MISFLRGKLWGKAHDHILIDVGGVGYRVWIPESVYGSLPSEGEQIEVFTYFHVREDSLQLFGFLNREQQEVFALLLQVTGIGPKAALAVVSALTPQAFKQAVVMEELKTLTGIPGIGKKTAQRIILELKEKVGRFTAGIEKQRDGFQSDVYQEALAALLALGYRTEEIEGSLRRVSRDKNLPAADLVRLVLKEFGAKAGEV